VNSPFQDRRQIVQYGKELTELRNAIIENTKGDLFWIGEILLAELEKETGFKGEAS
jgi:hypothetical protein